MLKMAPVLASMVAEDIGLVIRQKRRNAMLYSVALVLFITAYAAAVASAAAYLASISSPLAAWLTVALIALSLSLLVVAVVAAVNWYEKRKRRRNRAARKLAATAALAAVPRVVSSGKALPVALALAGALFVYSQISSTNDEAEEGF